VSLAGLDEAGVQALRDAAEHAERDLAAKGAELSKMTVAVHAAEEEAIEARAARDHALIRVERLERECADALVLAGELNADGELTQRGFARLVAAAPESARARAVERRGGAALPKVSHADRAAAALSLAAPTVDSPSKGFGVEAGGSSSRDDREGRGEATRGGGQTGDDPTIIEGYLRELRDLRERVQAKDAEVADRDAKLEEAKEDLRRDEAIFAEKMKEIKTLRRAAKEAERERERRERTHREELAALNAALTTRAERPGGGGGPGDALGLPPAPEAMPRTPTPAGGKPAAEAAEAADVSFAGSDWELPRGLEAASGSLPATPSGALPSGALPSGAFPSGDAFEAFEEAGSGGSERDRLLREKSEIEAEKAKVEEEARRKARAHAGERRSLERQLRDLEQNISSKESLIADLERNEAEAKGLKRRYELRMRALEEEKAAKEAEVERLRAALEEMEKSGAHTAEEMREARARYERDVRAAQAQLEALRAEKRESAEIRGDEARLRAEESGKVRELEQEVARARGTRDELKRRLREREDAHAKAQALRGEEIGALKKQAETQSRRIKELVSAKERQREALRKKTDELAAANRELERLHTRPGGERRPVAGQHMVAVNAAAARLEAADAVTTPDAPDQRRSAVGVGGAMSSRERAHAYGERVKSRNRGDAGAGADRDGDFFGEKRSRSNANANANANAAASDPVVQVDVSALRAMIDAESRRALKIRLGEEERLRVEAKRRAVNEEREETTRARDALVLRSERSAAQLEKERRELVRVLDALDDRLTAALKSGGGAEGEPDAIAPLRDRRDAAAERLATVEGKLAAGDVLTAEERAALRDLEDRLDGLEAEAEYIAAARSEYERVPPSEYSPHAASAHNINKRRGRGGGAGSEDSREDSSEPFERRVARMAGAELASALSVALDEVVATKLREREKDSRAAELEVQLSDAQCAIEEMERGLRAREMDYDRRVVELQRRHSKKEAYLMRMTNAVTAQVDALERARASHPSSHPPSTNATEGGASGNDTLASGSDLRPDFSSLETTSGGGETAERDGSALDVVAGHRVGRDALAAEHRETRRANKELKRRIRALLVEREEMEAAAAKLEERLESSSRAAQTLRDQVRRLSVQSRRSERSGAASRDVVVDPFAALDAEGEVPVPARGATSAREDAAPPSLPARPALPETPKFAFDEASGGEGSSAGGGGGGGGGRGEAVAGGGVAEIRVSRFKARELSLAEVEAARLNTPGGYPGAGGSVAGRRGAAAAFGKRADGTGEVEASSPVSKMRHLE